MVGSVLVTRTLFGCSMFMVSVLSGGKLKSPMILLETWSGVRLEE